MDKAWVKAALIRAVKTVCQTAAAMIGTSAVIEQVDWRMVVSASILAGILSILTSIGGLPEVKSQEDEILEEKPELPDGYFEEGEEDE